MQTRQSLPPQLDILPAGSRWAGVEARAGGRGKAGSLLGIASRAQPKAPMDQMSAATITVESGVEGDFRGKPGRRQVTVLDRRAWQAACSALGIESLAWTTRRANLLVDDIDLAHKVGWELRIGEVVLAITGETRPCQRMDQACPGLQEALKSAWRGGVTCQVIRSGYVQLGCEVVLTRNLTRQKLRVIYQRGRYLAKEARRVLGAMARRIGLRRPRRGRAR
jgi:MOSC domain-containing protein YiiM